MKDTALRERETDELEEELIEALRQAARGEGDTDPDEIRERIRRIRERH